MVSLFPFLFGRSRSVEGSTEWTRTWRRILRGVLRLSAGGGNDGS